jgi:hypothetical protein
MATSFPVICIGGAPSSGTTLLADLLDAVPGVLCGPEFNMFCTEAAFRYDADFKAQAIARQFFSTNSCYAPQSRFFNTRYLEQAGLTAEQLTSMIEQSNSLAEFVTAFAQHFASFRQRECHVFAEKTPINVGHAQTFCRSFTNGVFVHVVRDGRAVVASLLRRGYTVWEAALIWMVQTSIGNAATRACANSLEIRFEDLVAAPFDYASRIASRVGVNAHADEIRVNYSSNTYRSNLPRVESWSAAEAPSRIQAPPPYWEQLSSDQIHAVEGLQLYSGNCVDDVVLVESFKQLLQSNQYCLSSKRKKMPLATIVDLHEAYQRDGSYLEIQRDWLFLLDHASVSLRPFPWTQTKGWFLQHMRKDWRRGLTQVWRIGVKSIAQIALLRSNDVASRTECLVHD